MIDNDGALCKATVLLSQLKHLHDRLYEGTYSTKRFYRGPFGVIIFKCTEM